MFERLTAIRPRAAVHWTLALAVGVLGISLGWVDSANAQSCGAAAATPPSILNISPGPNLGTNMFAEGELAEIKVTVINNSRNNTLGGVDVAAKLINTVGVQLACDSANCATKFPGTLVLQPMGCEAEHPQVVGCVLDPLDPLGNTVKITMSAAGVPLAAGGSEIIATLTAVATEPVTFSQDGQFFVRALTGVYDPDAPSLPTDGTLVEMQYVEITDPICQPAPVTGGGSGSTSATFPEDDKPPFITIQKDCGICDETADPPGSAFVHITVQNQGEGDATGCRVVDTFDPDGGADVIFNELVSSEGEAPGTVLAGDTIFIPAPPGDPDRDSLRTPPFTVSSVLNEVTIVCDDPGACSPTDDPPCQFMDEADDFCTCNPFIPCIGIECDICPPRGLKDKLINPF